MTGILINIVIGIVLSVASTLLQQAFFKPQEQQRRTGTRGSVLLGGKVPQYFLIGTVGEAGKREYRNTWGTAGEVPNANVTDVYSFGDVPITDLVGLFINGVRVTLSASGAVAQGYPVPEYAGHFWWKFLPGTQTTADSYLISKFGSDDDRAWTSDMIGRGVPVLITTALWSETLWTGFPTVVGEFQGIKLYDPRKDSTAGGSGSQRWANPATWAFSDNSAVIVYNILRGIHYDGAKLWGGSASAAQLPYDVWAAAMEACDDLVPLAGGGSERRFRAGRRISLNERPADVIRELLIGCNGRISCSADGTVYIIIGVPDEVDGSFTDADVLATEPLGSIPFPNLDEVINGATATYREPAQAWSDKETAPYYRSDLEAEDDDRQQVEGLDLNTTFSGTQAQRILKAVIEEGRRFRRHVVALPPEFAQFRPLQVLSWTSGRFDYTAKRFLITARTVEPFGKVILGLQEIDPADHDWTPATDEKPLAFSPVVVNRPPPQPMLGFAVSPYTFVDADLTGRRPGILLEYTGAMPDIRAVLFEVREDFGDGNTVATGEITYDTVNVNAAQPIGGIWTIPNADYEVRAKFLPPDGSGRETEWSEWLAVTTPNVKLTERDISVDLAQLAGEQLGQLAAIRSLIEQFKQVGTLIEEIDRENYHERQSLFREIMVQVDGLTASFTEVIEVALGPGGAIATQLESLYAALGGNTSEVNVRWQATAAPTGYSARYAIQAAVNDGTFRGATFFLDVPEDPDEPTRIGLMAGQTVFFTSLGVPIVAMNEDGRQVSANGVKVIDWVTGAESTTVED